MGADREDERAAFGLRVRCQFDAPGVAEASASGTARSLDAEIADVGSPPAAAEAVLRMPLPAGELAILRARSGALHFAHPYFGRFELTPDGTGLRCGPERLEPWQWQRFLVGQLLPAAALAQGLGPMHCAAAEVDGRAVLLLGTSGAGKTTALLHCMARGAAMLADDVAALELTERGVLAHPGSALCNVATGSLDTLPEATIVLGTIEGEARVRLAKVHPDPVEVGAVCLLVRRHDTIGVDVSDELAGGSWAAALLGAHFSPTLAAGFGDQMWLETTAALAERATLRVIRSGVGGDPHEVAAAIMAP